MIATVSKAVRNCSLPELRAIVAKAVEPFLKVTVPAGVPLVAGFTVAVKVTDLPKVDGLRDDTTVVVVEALLPT